MSIYSASLEIKYATRHIVGNAETMTMAAEGIEYHLKKMLAGELSEEEFANEARERIRTIIGSATEIKNHCG